MWKSGVSFSTGREIKQESGWDGQRDSFQPLRCSLCTSVAQFTVKIKIYTENKPVSRNNILMSMLCFFPQPKEKQLQETSITHTHPTQRHCRWMLRRWVSEVRGRSSWEGVGESQSFAVATSFFIHSQLPYFIFRIRGDFLITLLLLFQGLTCHTFTFCTFNTLAFIARSCSRDWWPY